MATENRINRAVGHGTAVQKKGTGFEHTDSVDVNAEFLRGKNLSAFVRLFEANAATD